MDHIIRHNRAAWNQQSITGSDWCDPVTPAQIDAARDGRPHVILTPVKPVPQDWLGDLRGARVLCLASGGGQQAPLLAAAGARVVSFDLSEEQLAKDRLVADRDGLELTCVQGDMADLSAFDDGAFDLIFNPVSVCFVPDVRAVWRECARVLRPGGRLLSGFLNPAFYLFDPDAMEDGRLEVRGRLPYREDDPLLLPPGRRAEVEQGDAMEFSHTLADLLAGQMAAGLALVDLLEDGWHDGARQPLEGRMESFVATLAEKRPARSDPS